MSAYQTMTLERMMTREMLKMHPDEAIRNAWEYFYSDPFPWYGNSFRLNRPTTVRVCPANDTSGYPEGTILHFTHTGEIYGTSETIMDDELLGTEPVFYYGYFEIDNHDFELSFVELHNGRIMFTPKPEASAAYHDMITMDEVVGERGIL
jgi:hypothetical protein